MSKLAEAYIRNDVSYIEKLENASFRYADLGNCYSYVEFNAKVNGEYYNKQLSMREFFEWIGGKILELDGKG